jgi:AraC family ethanolamine operon transcriptional activator
MVVSAVTVARLRYSEPEEISAAVPGVRLDAMAQRAGPFEAEALTLGLGALRLQVGRVSSVLSHTVIEDGSLVVFLPLSRFGERRMNGLAVGPGDVACYGSGAELLTATETLTGYMALTMPVEAADAALCPRQGQRLARQGRSGVFRTSLPAWHRATRIATTAAEATGMEGAGCWAHPGASEGLRASLIDAMRALFDEAAHQPPSRRALTAEAWHRVVLGAKAYLRADPMRPVYTEELCAALGVSASGLAAAFRGVFGVSPHRYLKLRRLALVRAFLRDPAGPIPLIKAVALSHGFWHLGQFAHDYRQRYGEAPSDTIARTRGFAAAWGGTRPEPRRA